MLASGEKQRALNAQKARLEQECRGRECIKCRGRVWVAWIDGNWEVRCGCYPADPELFKEQSAEIRRYDQLVSAKRRNTPMTLATVTQPPDQQLQKAVTESAYGMVRDEATYEIRFGGKNPRFVRAISAKGARELYIQCARRGLAYSFKPLEMHDKQEQGFWIVDAVWEATDPVTGYSWTFTTRGAEPYNAQNDTLAVANRKAWGKAERNACLECVPMPIRNAFLALLSNAAGTPVVESEETGDLVDQRPAKPSGKPEYQRFYEAARDKGYAPLQALGLLGVTDWNNWVKRGGTLDSALERLSSAAEISA